MLSKLNQSLNLIDSLSNFFTALNINTQSNQIKNFPPLFSLNLFESFYKFIKLYGKAMEY